MAEVLANGLRFHVQRVAPARHQHLPADHPTVVFLHGLAVDDLSSFYYTLADPVAKAGFEVILYDQRGQGLSERPPEGYGLDDAVADLFAILDAVDICRPVVLIGNSYGGILAGRAALARPERVAGLVLIDAGFAGDIVDEWLERMINTLSAAALQYEVERIGEQCAAVGWRKIARQAIGINALLNETTLIEDLAAAPAVDPARLSEMACPVLAVFGEHSEMVGAARELADQVPDCTVKVLPGLAHTLLREATDPLSEVVVSWLGSHAGARR
ncbi:alpha/beta fold hydrolase [Rhodococcus daqingensis]|uniref:Alpha/beta fold hydrolase n=1 Tax=Rhodococcus daqingensis TaxID=2479363 RepID=A0ABW2S437_9NOCA